ncbi:hypothetical protein PP413_24240, partial [Mycobacteroides abscessus]|nr:hypothetical protein [Mycobacteroides abscessus]
MDVVVGVVLAPGPAEVVGDGFDGVVVGVPDVVVGVRPAAVGAGGGGVLGAGGGHGGSAFLLSWRSCPIASSRVPPG